MSSASDFDLSRVREQTFVRHVDFHFEIGSTNSHAMQLVETDHQETPLLVLAERQTDGRGRGANGWWSSDGSLTFSLIMPLVSIPADQVPRLSLTVGLAICQAIESIAPQADLALKWPNDVYMSERKLAGILIELPAHRPPHAVIGVGINVNNSALEAPEALSNKCITLADSLDGPLNRTDVLIRCLQQLERQWSHLITHPHALVDQWRAYDLLLGRHIELDHYDGVQTGLAAGIDDDGALLIDTPLGRRRCVGGVVRSWWRESI